MRLVVVMIFDVEHQVTGPDQHRCHAGHRHDVGAGDQVQTSPPESAEGGG